MANELHNILMNIIIYNLYLFEVFKAFFFISLDTKRSLKVGFNILAMRCMYIVERILVLVCLYKKQC